MKRFLIILLCLLMTVSFCACGPMIMIEDDSLQSEQPTSAGTVNTSASTTPDVQSTPADTQPSQSTITDAPTLPAETNSTLPTSTAEPTQNPTPTTPSSPTKTPKPTPVITVTPNATPTPVITATPTPTPTPKPQSQSIAQTPDVRDYTYSWWPDGAGNDAAHNFCVQTGYYGLSFSSVTGMPIRMGYISNTYSQSAALTQNQSVINTLPQMSVAASVTLDKPYYFNGTITKAPYCQSVIRIIESGQYMQSFEAAAMVFTDANGNKNSNVVGRTEIKATPKYFALNYQMFFQADTTVSALNYSMTFTEYFDAQIAQDGKSAIFKGANGGFCIVIPSGTIYYDRANKTITIQDTSIVCQAKKYNGLSAIIIPSASPSQSDIDYYNAISNLSFTTTQIAPSKGKAVKTTFDATRGVWEIDTNRMVSATSANFKDEKYQNLADRVSFSITNNSNKTVTVPLSFKKKGNFAVEGFGPMIRDINTGEPVGLQVQISKNWHVYNTEHKGQWYYGLDGIWFNGYTYVEVPAGQTVTYEYMNAYNNYGNVYVASHSQLCLIGWPSNSTHQIWHTSTIGSSSEAFCYDPDSTCGYGFINDVRGVGFDPYDNGGKYVWGCNNGGGNFLWYGNNGPNNYGQNNYIVGYKNVKVFYKTQAPNMAEVIFSGVTQDDAVKFKITTYICRTNDVSRATHTFEYNFLKDVSFQRMAFYQIGGDKHSSGRWHGITIGNDNGPIEYTLAGVKYGAEAEIPVRSTAGYIGNDTMQRIEVPGKGLWVAFTNSYPKVNSDYFDGENANRTLSLLEFDATLNGVKYSKPAFNIRTTKMFCGDSNIVELCPPAAVGNWIGAGSYVKGAVEYINLPFSLSSVYFNSQVLKSIPAEEFDTWRLAYRYAMGDKTVATASIGTVVRQYPIAVKCQSSGDVLAQVSIKGGISYLPITFTNVPSFADYRLEKKVRNKWEMVDQSYFGNDYWQTYYDPETGKYELTFNVEHSGDVNAVYEYRLVKK